LDEAAQVGGHCEACTGKVCCQKLTATLQQFSDVAAAASERTWNHVRAQLKPALHAIKNDEPITPEILPMTIDELADRAKLVATIAEPIRLVDALRKEMNTVVRQLIEEGEAVPGHAVKPGNPTLTVRKADGVPMDPVAIYGLLSAQGVLAGMSEQEFIRRTSELKPTALRAMLADLHGLPEEIVLTDQLAPMGEQNPIEFSQKDGTVISTGLPVVEEKPKQEAKPVAKATGRRR
jgi:hypothetical protein